MDKEPNIKLLGNIANLDYNQIPYNKGFHLGLFGTLSRLVYHFGRSIEKIIISMDEVPKIIHRLKHKGDLSMNLIATQLRPMNAVNTIPINPPTSQYFTTYGGDRVLRCAVYARVSTEMDSQKTSIENQIDLFRNYAAQNNWEVVEIYTDKQSGTKGNRPGLKALLKTGKLVSLM